MSKPYISLFRFIYLEANFVWRTNSSGICECATEFWKYELCSEHTICFITYYRVLDVPRDSQVIPTKVYACCIVLAKLLAVMVYQINGTSVRKGPKPDDTIVRLSKSYMSVLWICIWIMRMDVVLNRRLSLVHRPPRSWFALWCSGNTEQSDVRLLHCPGRGWSEFVRLPPVSDTWKLPSRLHLDVDDWDLVDYFPTCREWGSLRPIQAALHFVIKIKFLRAKDIRRFFFWIHVPTPVQSGIQIFTRVNTRREWGSSRCISFVSEVRCGHLYTKSLRFLIKIKFRAKDIR